MLKSETMPFGKAYRISDNFSIYKKWLQNCQKTGVRVTHKMYKINFTFYFTGSAGAISGSGSGCLTAGEVLFGSVVTGCC